MKITKNELLELLSECVRYLDFCVGGTNVDGTLAKVCFVLESVARDRTARLNRAKNKRNIQEENNSGN